MNCQLTSRNEVSTEPRGI